MRLALGIAAAFLVLVRSSHAAEDGLGDALAAVDRLAAADVAARDVPGLAIAVTRGSIPVWRHDYGVANLADNAPVNANTSFRLASISKLFTALAILRLRDEGRLDLDDRVTRHLPWFRLADQPHPEITLRQLLLHRSGLPREAPGGSWTDRVMPDHDALIRDLAGENAALAPEVMWKYSNLGYAILGLVVEAVSGQPYATYVSAQVLAPLGMAHTLIEPKAAPADLATGYGARGPGGRQPRPYIDMGGVTPAAGIISTSDDLVRLAAWMLSTADGPIVSAATRREMLRVQAVYPDWSGGQGLGFQTRRVGATDRIGHAGQAGGYAGRIEVDPTSGLGIVVLTNADEGGPTRLIDKVMAVLGPAIAAASPKPPMPIPDPAWTKYVGLYTYDHRDSAIVIADGHLAWQDPSAADPAKTRILLDPAGPDRFRFQSGALIGEILRFETDESGKVTRMLAAGNYDWRK